MDLLLWRHAEAGEARDGEDDLDRALTAKGERQAQRVGDWLARQLPSSARVLASPAKRAQQTVAALDRKFKTVDAIAPDRSVDSLLVCARWPEAREPVLLVGHQPTLGLAASLLLTGQAEPWTIRKGAVWWLRGRERDGRIQVVLHGAISPDLL